MTLSFNTADQDPTIRAIERVTETMLSGVGTLALSPAAKSIETIEAPDHSREAGGELELPSNIHELLDTSLYPADMSGRTTRKYRVNGHPGLLVRHVPRTTIEETSEAMQIVRDYKLPALPASLVEHKGKPYLITSIVDGEPLTKVLPTATPELLATVDDTWAKLVLGLKRAFRTNQRWPEDIDGPHQYMVGTIPGDTKPRLWLTDLPTEVGGLHDHWYGQGLIYTIQALRDIEQFSGTVMTRARQALAEAVAICPNSPKVDVHMQSLQKRD